MIVQKCFEQVLNMSITGGIMILAVLIMRLFLKRVPKIFSYVLWAVVLFRLLCPVSVTSGVSLLGVLGATGSENGGVEYAAWGEADDAEWLQDTAQDEVVSQTLQAGLTVQSGQAENGFLVGAEINEGAHQSRTDKEKDGNTQSIETQLSSGQATTSTGKMPASQELFIRGGAGIWLLGMLVLAVYSVCQWWKLKKQLGVTQLLRDNIYLADYISTPFVIGLLRPRIYLPSALKAEEQSYIILHEQHHIHRGDHIWKLFAFVALCVHWFHPLVWLAFVLSAKDMEMSCDEAVMKKLKGDMRVQYSESLLRFATGKRMIAGAPLAFGEGNTKERVKNVMHYKKPAFRVVLVALVVCVAVSVCLITNPGNKATGILSEVKQPEDLAVGAKFESDACLYMTPLSSYMPINGDSGYTYEITEDAFLKINKSSGETISIPVASWGWQEFPYTDEEWAGFYLGKDDSQIGISEIYEEILYQPLGGREFLLSMDGKIWLVNLHQDGFLWYIYSLKQLGETTVAVDTPLLALDAEDYTLLPGRTYRSSEAVQYGYDTNILPLDGDSGYAYRIKDDRFIFINMVYGSSEEIIVTDWEWKEFPYTREYWTEIAGSRMVELYDNCEKLKYLPLSESYYLLLADGVLLLAERGEFREYPDYVGDVYTLVLAQEEEDTHIVQKAYEMYYEQCPEAAYSAEEWLGADGVIGFPFDWRDTLEMSNPEREVIYYVPREALDRATTEDLVKLLVGYDHRSRFDIYNYISHYWNYVQNSFNVADELLARKDLAQAVLEAYQRDQFLRKSSFGDEAKQKAYDEQCYEQFNKIGLEEIILATNLSFDQMTDEMRKATIEEALNKVDARLSGKFKCSYGLANGEDGFGEFPSGFFAYIIEMEESTGSKWYLFMKENGYDELLEKLDGLSVRDCWPQ